MPLVEGEAMRIALYCRLLAGFVALTLLAPASGVEAQRRRRGNQLRIAMISDGASPRFVEIADGFRREIVDLLGGSTELVIPERAESGDFTRASSERLLNAALADRNVDLIVALGPWLGVLVGERERLNKPVVLPFAVPSLQGLPIEGNRSGRQNLSYVTGLASIERDLRRLRDVVRFARVAMLIDADILAAMPASRDFITEAGRGLGLDLTIVPVGLDANEVLAAIPDGTELAYVGPTGRFEDSELEALAAGLVERRLPSFASAGPHAVRLGFFATATPEGELHRRMRRVALNIERIHEGEDAGALPVAFEPRTQIIINMATARAIGVYPRFDVLTEAQLINDVGSPAARTLSLVDAIELALAGNRDLAAADAGVRAGAQNIDQTRARLLPQLNLTADFTQIDPDVASNLGNAERTISWGVSGRQLLWSPLPFADRHVQRAAQEAREQDYGAQRLDTILETGVAYLDVLRASTLEQLQKDNLARTRVNLELAEVRVQIGSGGREEIYRWQIEVANGRTSVIEAIARRNQTEIALNRLLNLPLEENVATQETSPEDAAFVVSEERFSRFLDDPWSFRVLRDYMAGVAARNAPEVRQIDAATRARAELLTGQEQTFWSPDVFVSGGFNHNLFNGGEGSEAFMAIPGVSARGRDDFTWQVGVGLSFNLFDGTERYADARQTRLELEQLREQRHALLQRVEQRVRSAAHAAGASRPAMRLAEDASTAATSNLELVTDAYRQGATDIIRLLDAQNQALVSQLSAANAVYDFLIDYMQLERAVGRFGFQLDESGRDELHRRMSLFERERRADDGVSRSAGDDVETPTLTNPDQTSGGAQ